MSRVEKYALIGVHGIGKSAEAHFLAAKLKKQDPSKSVKVLEETVRETSKLVGLNNPEFQKLSITSNIYNQVFYSSMYDIIICDRIALDYAIYAKYFRVALPEEYFQLSYQNATEFDKIYFIRPDKTPIASDGFRFTNLKEREELDKLFKFVLETKQIKYEEITTTDVFK